MIPRRMSEARQDTEGTMTLKQAMYALALVVGVPWGSDFNNTDIIRKATRKLLKQKRKA